jgi:hypothetical protein
MASSRRYRETVASYLVETYLARGQVRERVARELRAQATADELTLEGKHVRFDRSIHVLEDEVCLFVFDAESPSDAALAAERAGLDPLRVVEAVSSGPKRRRRRTR